MLTPDRACPALFLRLLSFSVFVLFRLPIAVRLCLSMHLLEAGLTDSNDYLFVNRHRVTGL